MTSAGPGEAGGFAAELKAQRAARGWTQVEFGKMIGYSGSFVSDVERAERSPSADFAQRCDEAFGLPGTFMRLYDEMRKNAYPPFFAPVVPLEREADRINGWSLGAVPGLLQTERYARSVIRAKRPRASDEEVERAVAARMDRQEILARPTPPRLWYVIAEGVLRQVVGDQEVMREQLDKLIKSASLPGIVIQVLTYEANDHPGVEGPIVVFEGQRMTAYTECVDGGRLVEEPGNVRDLMELIELLRAAALSPRESIRFMQERRRDLD